MSHNNRNKHNSLNYRNIILEDEKKSKTLNVGDVFSDSDDDSDDLQRKFDNSDDSDSSDGK